MYAIIEVNGRQYKVDKDAIIDVEHQDKEDGKSLIFNKVLLVADKDNIQIGQPYLKGIKVKASVLKNLKAPRVVSYKYRRRKSSHWKKGHRQLLTRVIIKEIAS